MSSAIEICNLAVCGGNPAGVEDVSRPSLATFILGFKDVKLKSRLRCGSSEIKIGHLGKRRFIAAIEPWHGNQAVVYTESGSQWKRHVIEDGMGVPLPPRRVEA